jgi:hypothetical protein
MARNVTLKIDKWSDPHNILLIELNSPDTVLETYLVKRMKFQFPRGVTVITDNHLSILSFKMRDKSKVTFALYELYEPYLHLVFTV